MKCKLVQALVEMIIHYLESTVKASLSIVELSWLDFKHPPAQLQQKTLHAPLPQHWKTGTLDPSRQVRVAGTGSTVPGQQMEAICVV